MKVDVKLRERLQVVPRKSCRQARDQSIIDACGVESVQLAFPGGHAGPPTHHPQSAGAPPRTLAGLAEEEEVRSSWTCEAELRGVPRERSP